MNARIGTDRNRQMKGRRLTLMGLATVVVAGGGFAAGAFLQRKETPPTVVAAPPPAQVRSGLRQAGELSSAFISIAQAVTPAVVRIEAEWSAPPDEAHTPLWLRDYELGRDSVPWDELPELGGGTGIVISTDGFILTNGHVVAGASRVTVALSDNRTYEARVVGIDPTTDLAVIRIPTSGLPAAQLGDSDSARVGEWVLAIGNPGFGDGETLDFTVTSGIISAKGRPIELIPQGDDARDDFSTGYTIEDFIQTDAAINPGNSGGPLVNLAGQVIGVNTAIASSTGFNQGYGFAIPSNLAYRVATDIIQFGKVRRPLLGVAIANVSAEDAEVYGLTSISGVLVEDLPEDSPAALAGMREHDVIVRLDSQRVDRVGQLQRLIAQRVPGDVVRLGVVRFGDSLDFRVRLSEAVIDGSAGPAAADSPPVADLGLVLADLDRQAAREYGYAAPGGVVVSDIAAFSPADRKGVRHGQRLVTVDRVPVTSAEQARALIRAVPRGRVVSLLLTDPDGRTDIVNVRVP
jgi:serine protease Do